MEFSNVGDFVIDKRTSAFILITFNRANGTTAVDFVFGVLMEIFVISVFSIEKTINILIDSLFSQSFENRSSSVFATCHKYTSLKYKQMRVPPCGHNMAASVTSCALVTKGHCLLPRRIALLHIFNDRVVKLNTTRMVGAERIELPPAESKSAVLAVIH